MWGSRIKIFEKKTVLPHLCCVCKHFWYIHVLSGTSQPGPDSMRENILKTWNVTKISNQLFTFLLPGQRKILPRVDMWAEKKDLIFIKWFSTLLHELLYFHFVNVCNAKSWNCLTKMIQKIRKRMSRLQKIDLAIIEQHCWEINQLVKMAEIERSKNFPGFIKLEDRNIRIH